MGKGGGRGNEGERGVAGRRYSIMQKLQLTGELLSTGWPGSH